MPLSADPNARARFSLSNYQDMPEARRPAFLVRFMSKAEVDEHRRLMDEATTDGMSTAQTMALVGTALELGIVGCVNMPVANWKDAIPLLSRNEFWELAWSYPNAVRPVGDDLKNLLWPSATAGTSPAVTPAAVAT